jgi:hypothetical protein
MKNRFIAGFLTALFKIVVVAVLFLSRDISFIL